MMNETVEHENWDVQKLDPDNWLEIPDFGVQPQDVDFKGFSDALVLAGKPPDPLIQAMRHMVSVLRKRTAHHFKNFAEMRDARRSILAAIERHHNRLDYLRSPLDQYDAYSINVDGVEVSRYLHEEIQPYQPSQEEIDEVTNRRIRAFTVEEIAAFNYMFIIQQFKRALDTKGRASANEFSQGADTLLGWVLSDPQGIARTPTEEEHREYETEVFEKIRKDYETEISEKILRQYKMENSKKANDERHESNRLDKLFIFKWLPLNRPKFKTDDETALFISGDLPRRKGEPDSGFETNGNRKKVVGISHRTASAWITEWNKKQPRKKPRKTKAQVVL